MPANRTRIRVLGCTALLAAALVPAGTATGTVMTLAGTIPGYAGDGGPADAARFSDPRGVAVTPDGALLIADAGNDRVRRVAPDGLTTTLAGTGVPPTALPPGTGGDGGPAAAASLDAPRDVALGHDGAVLIADTGANRVRRVGGDGVIRTVAGSAGATAGLAGDGGPATLALLSAPSAIAPTPDGGLLIADTGNSRIRRVGPDGIITTVAGTDAGLSGDGGPATSARLNAPEGVTALADGGFLIADTGNRRVRRVAADGTITTVAGLGVGFAGDGGPVAGTALAAPTDALALADGGLLIADAGADRLRRVTPLGAVVTVAGGRRALGGDGGPTAGGLFDTPTTLVGRPDGSVVIGDTGNGRVRAISDLGPLPDPEPLRTVGVAPLTGVVMVRPRNRVERVTLTAEDLAPNLSVVDASGGSVRLRVRGLDSTEDRIADVGGTRFTLVQPAGEAAVADLRLTAPLRCRRAVRAGADEQQRARRPVQRRIRIKVRGRYRTSGRYATAIANGTSWTMTDRCDRTIIRVSEGVVTVRDLRRNRSVKVRAGRRYVALARPVAVAPRRR